MSHNINYTDKDPIASEMRCKVFPLPKISAISNGLALASFPDRATLNGHKRYPLFFGTCPEEFEGLNLSASATNNSSKDFLSKFSARDNNAAQCCRDNFTSLSPISFHVNNFLSYSNFSAKKKSVKSFMSDNFFNRVR